MNTLIPVGSVAETEPNRNQIWDDRWDRYVIMLLARSTCTELQTATEPTCQDSQIQHYLAQMSSFQKYWNTLTAGPYSLVTG